MASLSALWDKTLLGFGRILLRVIQSIAEETVSGESPYGLAGHGSWFRDHQAKWSSHGCRWEEIYSLDIAQRLAAGGFPAFREVGYPWYCFPAGTAFSGKEGHCDLVVHLADSRYIWIAVKTAWTYDFSKNACGKPDLSGASCMKSKGLKHATNPTKGIPKDVVELEKLKQPDAHHIGILLLGFDCDRFRMHSADPRLGLECLSSWSAAHVEDDNPNGWCWPDKCEPRRELGFKDHCWFWYRPTIDGR